MTALHQEVCLQHTKCVEQKAEVERLKCELARIEPVVAAARDYVSWHRGVYTSTIFEPTRRLIEAVDAAGEDGHG